MICQYCDTCNDEEYASVLLNRDSYVTKYTDDTNYRKIPRWRYGRNGFIFIIIDQFSFTHPRNDSKDSTKMIDANCTIL
jgi:hypothetical protein